MADLDIHLSGISIREEDAFVRWMAGAEPAIRRSLARFSASVDVEAVVQDTLLRIWQIAPRHSPDGKPNSLLRLAVRIARNRAIDETKRTNRVIAYESLDQLEREFESWDPSPDPLLQRLLRLCLAHLRGKPKQALWARLRASGEADAKLAESLEMAVNTFRQNVSRARKAVRECLAERGVAIEEVL